MACVLGSAAPLHDHAITLDVVGMKNRTSSGHAPSAVSGLVETRHSNKTDRPATPVAIAGEPERASQQRRSAGDGSCADTGKVPAPGQSGERHRHLGFTHNPQDGPPGCMYIGPAAILP